LSLFERLFPRWRPRTELRPRGDVSGTALRVSWLGTAGHVVSSATTTLLVDPYLSRRRFRQLARPLVPDEEEIFKHLPDRVDAVLLGHSHFDHLLDAPVIARRTGAKIVGSATTCAFARASGVPEAQIVEVPAEGKRLKIGDFDVRFVPSLHGRIALGRVPFPGEVRRPPQLPVRFHRYRMGGAFGILMRSAGVRVYHNGSADLVDAELAGERADVLLVGLAGRKATPDYLGRLLRALQPSVVVPTHHDAFFAPLGEGVRLLPGIDLEGFVSETHRLSRTAAVITPDYHEVLGVPARDARGALLMG
jgi:L-ascorbate metabolism protein UlaG (beta-lactamase superfamily)